MTLLVTWLTDRSLFSDDIVGDSWPFGNAWDIGADEYTSVTAVLLNGFTATEYEGKVLLEWRTGYEANNLGFHVYRQEGRGQLTQITPEFITGGAFLVGAGRAMAGHSYAWWDTFEPTAQRSVVYWLEDIDLSGKRTRHGPVIPGISLQPPPARAQAALLSQLSRGLSEKEKAAFRPSALQTRLGKNQTSNLGPQTSGVRHQPLIFGLRPSVLGRWK